jgi:hypothetical protein
MDAATRVSQLEERLLKLYDLLESALSLNEAINYIGFKSRNYFCIACFSLWNRQLKLSQSHSAGFPPRPKLYIRARVERNLLLRILKFQCLPWHSSSCIQRPTELETYW